eukprot:8495665-Pyramimonas_sp.AAC.1
MYLTDVAIAIPPACLHTPNTPPDGGAAVSTRESKSSPRRPLPSFVIYIGVLLILHFTAPPVPITARMHSTPQKSLT